MQKAHSYNSDSKGEKKETTYCPTTWNYGYTLQYAPGYAALL